MRISQKGVFSVVFSHNNTMRRKALSDSFLNANKNCFLTNHVEKTHGFRAHMREESHLLIIFIQSFISGSTRPSSFIREISTASDGFVPVWCFLYNKLIASLTSLSILRKFSTFPLNCCSWRIRWANMNIFRMRCHFWSGTELLWIATD